MQLAKTPIENGLEPRFSVPGTALSRLLQEAAYLPRCSDNKTAALVRPRAYAIRWPYMQVNRRDRVSWLVFDLDHSNPLIWQDVGLPAPNIIVSNRKNQHAHLYYAIKPVCTSENARSAPINYMKAVYVAMAIRLDADPAYRGPVAKTPGHPWWVTEEVHHHEYDLGKLADYVDLKLATGWGQKKNLDAVAHSRHCTLFEDVRFYAYSIVSRERERGSYRAFEGKVADYAHAHNQFRSMGFSANLRTSQVKATIKSVSRWTWDYYRGGADCNRGVMQLDKTLPLPVRQRMAARYTHQTRQTATERKIKEACQGLLQRGTAFTQEAIAAATGLTRQTVAKYQHAITEIKTAFRAQKTAQAFARGQSADVNYAAHQITVGDKPASVFGFSGNGGDGGRQDGVGKWPSGRRIVDVPAVLDRVLGMTLPLFEDG